jgi:hypothetical protein
MDRRGFVRGAGLGAVIAAAGAGPAWGQRLRILEPEPAGGPALLPVPGATSPELAKLIATVRVGQVWRQGALIAAWLHGAGQSGLQVATLEEARGRGDLTSAERGQAQVPELIVDNRGKVHVLLLAGEILIGGKQNRVLREDILLPPRSGPRALGVYCVEQGRWSGGRAEFDGKGTVAPSAVRSRAMSGAGQDQVWAAVDRSLRATAAAPPTANLQQAYEQRDVLRHLAEVERAPGARPAPPVAGDAGAVGAGVHAIPGTLGAAVFVGSRLAGVDLFSDAGLFARQWPKLLRAHALDAYRAPDPAIVDETWVRGRVDGLLQATARALGTARGNAGVGSLFEFRVPGGHGAALIAEGRVVHAAVL